MTLRDAAPSLEAPSVADATFTEIATAKKQGKQGNKKSNPRKKIPVSRPKDFFYSLVVQVMEVFGCASYGRPLYVGPPEPYMTTDLLYAGPNSHLI